MSKSGLDQPNNKPVKSKDFTQDDEDNFFDHISFESIVRAKERKLAQKLKA